MYTTTQAGKCYNVNIMLTIGLWIVLTAIGIAWKVVYDLKHHK